MGDVFAATTQYYEDMLGVDVRNRMPSLKNIHLLSTGDFRSLRKRLGKQDYGLDIYGFPIAERDMVLRQIDDDVLSMYVMQHELGHILGAKLTRLTKNDTGIAVKAVRDGFNPEKTFLIPEEFTVEKSIREIIKSYWPLFNSIKALHPQFKAHQDVIELGDAIIKRLGADPDKVLRALQLAHLSGDMTGLSDFLADMQQMWGPQIIREVATTGLGAETTALTLRLARNR